MKREEIIISALFTIVGFLLAVAYDFVKERLRFRREMKENNNINLSGFDWVAAWQTSVSEQEVLNTEEIIIEQRGGVVKMRNKIKSPQNPKGGYLWSGQLHFYQCRDLMGYYFSIKQEQNTNKGIMYFCYDSAKKIFIGRWVGASYDGPLTSGFGVISKNRETSIATLKELLKAHPGKVAIISQTI